MTLVFMEREYSTPEEPHLGIVHIVEVETFAPDQQSHGAGLSCRCWFSPDISATMATPQCFHLRS